MPLLAYKSKGKQQKTLPSILSSSLSNLLAYNSKGKQQRKTLPSVLSSSLSNLLTRFDFKMERHTGFQNVVHFFCATYFDLD